MFAGSLSLQSDSALRCTTVVARNSRADGGGGSLRRRPCRRFEAPAITESKLEFAEGEEKEWKYDASFPDGPGSVDGRSSPDCIPRRPDVLWSNSRERSFTTSGRGTSWACGSVERVVRGKRADGVGGNSGGKSPREETGVGVAIGCGR